MSVRTPVLFLLLLGTVQAQSWAVKEGKLALVGCYGAQDGIYCEFAYTLLDKQVAPVFWNNDFVTVFTQSGGSQPADKVAFADHLFGLWSSKLDVLANTPLKVLAYFNLPNTTASFKAIEVAGKRFNTIPVRALSAPGQAPVGQMPPTGVVPLSSLGGYSLDLSNCKAQGQSYVCTITLTPTR